MTAQKPFLEHPRGKDPVMAARPEVPTGEDRA